VRPDRLIALPRWSMKRSRSRSSRKSIVSGIELAVTWKNPGGYAPTGARNPVVSLPSLIRHGFASHDECQTLVAARTD
jgi:hypothetical protein